MWTEIARLQCERAGRRPASDATDAERALDHGHRQALRYREGVRGGATPLGRRTHLRRARALPPPRQGLGENHPERRNVAPDRPYPPRHTSACKGLRCLMEFRIGLLQCPPVTTSPPFKGTKSLLALSRCSRPALHRHTRRQHTPIPS